jgi:surface antigen
MLKTRIKSVLGGFLCAIFLSACNAAGPIDNHSSGALIGGVVGGAACSGLGKGHGRIAAAIACTLAGAFIGGAVGSSMDSTDQLRAQRAISETPTNETVSWYNPNSKTEYKVTPIEHPQTYGDGRTCREFSTTAIIGGKSETVYGTACQQRDGSWQMQNG